MKLSDAIRLGAMWAPQGFGDYEYAGKTCAFGAAYQAIGEGHDDHRAEHLIWPWLTTVVPCPAECGSARRADSTVAHLNDFHRWTREQIADWIESIEPAEDQRSRSLVRSRAGDPVDRIVESAEGAQGDLSSDLDLVGVAGRPPRGDQ